MTSIDSWSWSLQPSYILHIHWQLSCVITAYIHTSHSLTVELCHYSLHTYFTFIENWAVSLQPTYILLIHWELSCVITAYTHTSHSLTIELCHYSLHTYFTFIESWTVSLQPTHILHIHWELSLVISLHTCEMFGQLCFYCRYGYHWPPYCSVYHLHLHLISTPKKIKLRYRIIGKYNPRTHWFKTVSINEVFINFKLYFTHEMLE